jgi:hypothetical protein
MPSTEHRRLSCQLASVEVAAREHRLHLSPRALVHDAEARERDVTLDCHPGPDRRLSAIGA